MMSKRLPIPGTRWFKRCCSITGEVFEATLADAGKVYILAGKASPNPIEWGLWVGDSLGEKGSLLKCFTAGTLEDAVAAADEYIKRRSQLAVDNSEHSTNSRRLNMEEVMVIHEETTPAEAGQMLKRYLRGLQSWKYTELMELFRELAHELSGEDREVLRIITER